MERAYLLIVEFDGTDFCGWQRQSEGRSVQLIIEDALARLAGSPRRATAAGRTDAGVHALGLPVSTSVPSRWTAVELLRALNAILPRDVAVREVRAVLPALDARRSALSRSYRYDVGLDASCRSPFRSRVEWGLGRPLDLDAMRLAATELPGEHDFRAFMVTGEPKPHYRCRIASAEWTPLGTAAVRFTVSADRFLHHMVRMLVGTLVDIGLGRRPESDMAHLLIQANNDATSPPAPAAGLSFVSADFPEQLLLPERATW
jgi:tRNA pseudouridine38-40 synthase